MKMDIFSRALKIKINQNISSHKFFFLFKSNIISWIRITHSGLDSLHTSETKSFTDNKKANLSHQTAGSTFPVLSLERGSIPSGNLQGSR